MTDTLTVSAGWTVSSSNVTFTYSISYHNNAPVTKKEHEVFIPVNVGQNGEARRAEAGGPKGRVSMMMMMSILMEQQA